MTLQQLAATCNWLITIYRQYNSHSVLFKVHGGRSCLYEICTYLIARRQAGQQIGEIPNWPCSTYEFVPAFWWPHNSSQPHVTGWSRYTDNIIHIPYYLKFTGAEAAYMKLVPTICRGAKFVMNSRCRCKISGIWQSFMSLQHGCPGHMRRKGDQWAGHSSLYAIVGRPAIQLEWMTLSKLPFFNWWLLLREITGECDDYSCS